MSDIVVKAKKLVKIYRLHAEQIFAVNEIDLEIRSGDFVSLMGPSGSGKTTLLDMIGCLDCASGGYLEILGNNVSKIRENSLVKIRRKNIGFVFQDFSLIPSLTALENLNLALYFAGMRQDKRRSGTLLEKVGLSRRIHHLPKQLSGGEKQRIAIARALITCPSLLIADEPTGHLDSRTSQEIFDLFHQLNQDNGLTIIIATHNEKLGSQTGRTVYLRDGQIVDNH